MKYCEGSAIINTSLSLTFLESANIIELKPYVLYKYGLRIYKVGILNYSQSGLWKKMLVALKGE